MLYWSSNRWDLFLENKKTNKNYQVSHYLTIKLAISIVYLNKMVFNSTAFFIYIFNYTFLKNLGFCILLDLYLLNSFHGREQEQDCSVSGGKPGWWGIPLPARQGPHHPGPSKGAGQPKRWWPGPKKNKSWYHSEEVGRRLWWWGPRSR